MPTYINHQEVEKSVRKFTIELTGIPWEKIIARDRNKHDVRARAIYSYIMRLWGFPYTEIGEFLGKDHTTVIHHIWLVKYKGWEEMILPKILDRFPELSTVNPPNPQPQ
jgi:chromosomal replication initiation ATPase DnaA